MAENMTNENQNTQDDPICQRQGCGKRRSEHVRTTSPELVDIYCPANITDTSVQLASRDKKLEEIRTLAEEIKYCVAGYVGWHAGIEAAATKILAILERKEP